MLLGIYITLVVGDVLAPTQCPSGQRQKFPRLPGVVAADSAQLSPFPALLSPEASFLAEIAPPLL